MQHRSTRLPPAWENRSHAGTTTTGRPPGTSSKLGYDPRPGEDSCPAARRFSFRAGLGWSGRARKSQANAGWAMPISRISARWREQPESSSTGSASIASVSETPIGFVAGEWNGQGAGKMARTDRPCLPAAGSSSVSRIRRNRTGPEDLGAAEPFSLLRGQKKTEFWAKCRMSVFVC